MSSYDAFAPIYDDWSAPMTEDVAFYVELAREADGPVVELAVGNGRVAVPVAEAIGRPLVGNRRVAAMLAGARGGPRPPAWSSTCGRETCASSQLDEPAGLDLLPVPLAAAPARLERPAPCLRTRRRLAAPGWALRLERLRVRPARSRPRSTGSGATRTASVHRCDYVPADNRVDVTLESGASISLWWVARSEWEALLDVAGLEIEALYGWFDRRPFDESSREFVYVARKPERGPSHGV